MTSAGLRIQLDRDQTIGRRIAIILFMETKGIDTRRHNSKDTLPFI